MSTIPKEIIRSIDSVVDYLMEHEGEDFGNQLIEGDVDPLGDSPDEREEWEWVRAKWMKDQQVVLSEASGTTAFHWLALNSTGWVPKPVIGLGNEASRWFLVASIAAIGMKTQLAQLVSVGIKPIVLMVGETVFLAGLVLGLWRWLG